MEPKEKKALFLSNLFKHLDGIVLIPTIISLQEKKILNYIHNEKRCSLLKLSKKFDANDGYLNVALRLLCAQGILNQKIKNNDVDFNDINLKNWINGNISSIYKICKPLYVNTINYKIIIDNSKKNIISENILLELIQKYCDLKTGVITSAEERALKHVEGALLGPIIVLLSRNGFFNDLLINQELSLEINKQWKNIINKLFYCVGIINNDNRLTEYGDFVLKRASSYGVTVSYLPTFRNINNLIYGDGLLLYNKKKEEEEVHVDRSMNVWGSGGAHNTYFKRVDKIILDLFNLPIEKQPKGFIDIGCGNGKLIEHIFDLIYYKTIRGRKLKDYPLFIVGSDFNYKALEATNKTIQKADIWAKTAFGDISDPDSLAKRLKKEHEINLCDLLNVRSFLDHNRIYVEPNHKTPEKSNSTGAFCYKGKKLNNDYVQQNLKEHFKKWYPYLIKYGLLIVELHTIDPIISSKNIGKTAITAYDASHGFSDQYILEYNLFLKVALEAGLKPDPEHEYIFPNKEIPIVSINRLIKN